ncbi:uncharacterized protein UTRI_03569 [Ustilago trichophora]|uniref:Uncharacterized protein n=1 Tax=Ustilago trichophora TaxID=86804 RepID=A0A5C3E4C2_9BASI|nr:uncharacterized protein UTRI_03569 [Ustilago trichophora]
MESTPNSAASSGSGSNSNSTELMIALSQIQQLTPLLDYRPGGLTHLLPTLLTPFLPTADSVPGESVQRYRANVDHAFRVAGELVGRVSDGSSIGSALTLAEKLMREGDEKARMLRVRKKRRLFSEQEKVLEVNSWGPPVPSRPNTTAIKTGNDVAKEAAKKDSQEMRAFLPSQNPYNTILTPAQQDLLPPTTAQAVQKYLIALHSYLKTADEKALLPAGISLRQIKARIATFRQGEFSLEVQIGSTVKAVIDASAAFSSEGGGELASVDLAGLTVGGVNETITTTTPSAFPIFRSLSSDILSQTTRAVTSSSTEKVERGHIWMAYKPVTEAVARLILAAAQFQA